MNNTINLQFKNIQNPTMELPSYATGPDYLEISYKPDLLISLILAQLTSNSVWELARTRIKTNSNTSSRYYTENLMLSIQQYIHDFTYHMKDVDRAEFYGWNKIDQKKRSLGENIVNGAMDIIIAQITNMKWFDVLDRWVEQRNDNLCIGSRNTIFDINKSYSQIREGKAAVQCIDEVTLAAALAMIVLQIDLDKVIFLGSPVHNMVFVNYGEGYLFDSKMMYTSKTIHKKFASSDKIQDALIKRFGRLSWIATSKGTYDIDKNKSSIDKKSLNKILITLNKFLGVELEKLRSNKPTRISYVEQARLDFEINSLKGPDKVIKQLEKLAKNNKVAELALYSARLLNVPHPEAYLKAAAANVHTRKMSENIFNINDALVVINNLRDKNGIKSLFNQDFISLVEKRVQLPDETLLFGGDHIAYAILFASLLYLSPHISKDEKEQLAISISTDISAVKTREGEINFN